MLIRPLFHFICCLLLLLSCRGFASKQTQLQKNNTLSDKEIKTDTITYDTINFKTMKSKEEYKIIKRFDVEGYKKNNTYGRYEFTDRNGMSVIQRYSKSEANGETYIDERHYPDSPYLYSCVYDSRGRIKVSLTEFHEMPIGKRHDYDTSGNVIKETDEDALYKFSIDDLILKMKREYNIDIENTEVISTFVRYKTSELDFPLYEIGHFVKHNTRCVYYLINGNTGKTLYITERVSIESDMDNEPVESILNEYKRIKTY